MSGTSGRASVMGISNERAVLPDVLELYRRRQLRRRSEAALDIDGCPEDEVMVSVEMDFSSTPMFFLTNRPCLGELCQWQFKMCRSWFGVELR